MSRSQTTKSVIETLEGRQMLAANPLGISQVSYADGVQLAIIGTNKADDIRVAPVSGGFRVSNGKKWSTDVIGTFNSISVKAGKGNDRITIDPSITTPAFLFGGRDNDTLNGGTGADKLYGQGGRDFTNGGAGDDLIVSIGDSTKDVNLGGVGNDSFWTDAREKISDLTKAEKAAGNVHQVAAFQKFSVVSKGKVKATSVGSDLNGENLADPTGGTSYKNFSTNPLFASTGPSADDIEQGYVGDCWFLSTLAAIAKTDPAAIRNAVTELGDGTYAVQFTNANGTKAFVRVDGDLPVTYGSNLRYAGLGAQGSTWVAIMEKAEAIFRYGNQLPSYENLNAGWMSEAFNDLGYSSNSIWNATDGEALLDLIQSELSAGKAVTYATTSLDGDAALVGLHAYTVDSIVTDGNGNRSLVLRNPWAIDGTGNDGINDGYVTISAADAYASFSGVISANV